MTIQLQFSEEIEKKLASLAASQGYADVAAFVKNLVENSVGQEAADDELRREFVRLADEWRHERLASSLAKRVAEHPAYRQIVAMGDKVVPLILAELEREPDHWFIALHEITGASPVPQQSRGKLAEMAQAWINWGRAQGYRW